MIPQNKQKRGRKSRKKIEFKKILSSRSRVDFLNKYYEISKKNSINGKNAKEYAFVLWMRNNTISNFGQPFHLKTSFGRFQMFLKPSISCSFIAARLRCALIDMGN